MSGHSFRPSIAKVQNAQKIFTSTKTNATIRDLEEEEGELEEKEGVVVSIKRDLINGAGWTVKDNEENMYVCSCASSMYEVPETVERGGILYPVDTVEVVFTINPVLRINTIKEIKSLGAETEKIDISRWTHNDESTTVIAKPKSALSISDGFIKLDYNNDNKVLADDKEVKTEGKKTNINTEKLSINSKEIDIGGIDLADLIEDNALNVSNDYDVFTVDSVKNTNLIVERANNMTQISIDNFQTNKSGVIGKIKNQKTIPIRELRQQLITDGNCVDTIFIDTDGIISIELSKLCPEERRITASTYNWLTPQVEARNYIKVIVKETCNYCDKGNNTKAEYINYCPSCKNWGSLVDSSTSKILCTSCDTQYCENCGTNTLNPSEKLKQYRDNYIIGYGTTCNQCQTQLTSGTNKQYVNYCPDCETWHTLYQEEFYDGDKIINVLTCPQCQQHFCCSCGISQSSHGIKITDAPVQYTKYKEALRRLKYIRDGA